MDKAILASLTQLTGRGVITDTIFILFAGYWEYVVVAVILGYLLIAARPLRRERALVIGLAILSAAIARFGIVNLIRFFYSRPRPFVAETFTPLLEHAATASFPSGHASFFMALAVYVLLVGRQKLAPLEAQPHSRKGDILKAKPAVPLNKPLRQHGDRLLTGLGWFLFASAVLIGLARAAAGLHWPSDILVGWLIGAMVSVVVWYVEKRFRPGGGIGRRDGLKIH